MSTEFRPKTKLTSVADRDRSNPAQPTPPKKLLVSSIWVGLGIGIIVASIAGDRYTQATSTDGNSANTRIIASTAPVIGGQKNLAQGGICLAENSKQDVRVALSLSQAHLVQANTNLQKFQSDYSRDNTLASQGKATRQQLQTAKAAYDLAQLQKNSALQGLQHAQAQAAAARIENC